MTAPTGGSSEGQGMVASRIAILAMLVCLLIVGCTAGDYRPPPVDPMAPGHDGSNGSGSGGTGM